MVRALILLLAACFGALIGAFALAYYLDGLPSGELVVRFGDRAAHLRYNEAAVYELPDGSVLYMARLRGPLTVIPTSEVGE